MIFSGFYSQRRQPTVFIFVFFVFRREKNFFFSALSQFTEINLKKEALRIDISEEFNDQSVITVPKTLKQFFTVVPSKIRLVTLVAFLLKIFNKKVRFVLKNYFYRSNFVEFQNSEGKVLLFLATNELSRFHHEILNFILNGDQEDDPDEQGDLQFGRLLDQNVKLFRLQGDMTHQVRTFALNENSMKIFFSRNEQMFSTNFPKSNGAFFSARTSLLEVWIYRVSVGSFNITRPVQSITFTGSAAQLD